MRIPKAEKPSSYLWHEWYAWFPVIIETEHTRELVWRETIERRRQENRGRFWWEYRDLTY